MRWSIYLPVFAVMFLAACTSPQGSPIETDCVSAHKIERINGLTEKDRLFELGEKEARVFVALDPRLLNNEYVSEQLVEQGVDSLVAWRLGKTFSLAIAVPFAAGCAVEVYGEPDATEKLLLMHEAAVVIIEQGLESRAAKEKIEQLFFGEFQRTPDKSLYDKAVARVREALAQKKKVATGASHTRRSPGGEKTPLHIAAEKGDVAAVERLLAEGVDVNARDRLGRMALHFAAQGGDACSYPTDRCTAGRGVSDGHRQVAALLIARGANVNSVDRYGTAPLQQTVSCDAVAMAKLLIDHGADVDHRGGQYTALESASTWSPRVALLLVESGANVNTSDAHTLETPLHNAVYCRNKELVEALLEHGADVNAKDQWGRTALDNANDPSVLEILERYANEMR